MIKKLILISCVLLAILLTLATQNSDSCHNPSFRFAAIGDYGSNTAEQADVAKLIKSWEPDFIITTGDNNYPSGKAETIDQNIGKYFQEYIGNYKGQYGLGAIRNNFYPTLGNHDWLDWGHLEPLKPYTDYFTLPDKGVESSSGNERYYDFVRGPVHFFALNSCWREPDGITKDSRQAAWFRNAISKSKSKWKIAFMHHHPRTSWPTTDEAESEWGFYDLGVSAIIVGEDHFYERIIDKNGLPYFVNGLGGRDIHYDFPNPATEGTEVRYNKDYGAMLVEGNRSCMSFKFINRNGKTIDSYRIGETKLKSTLRYIKEALNKFFG